MNDSPFIPTLEWLRGYKAQIEALPAEHGASNVRVFGSVARGDATPDSDRDLLVKANKGTDVFQIIGLWQELQALFGREVSLVTDGIDDQQFLNTIRDELILL